MPTPCVPKTTLRPVIGNRRRVAIVVLLALVVLPLAGCGKKGDPEPPDGETSFPRTYPSQ